MTPIDKAHRKKLRIIEKASYTDMKILKTRNLLLKSVYKARRHFLPYYFMPPPLWRVLFRAIQPGQRAVPDFACIGPVRSGTTLLTDYIMQHPAVALPLTKELNISKTPMLRLILAQFPRKSSIKPGMITGFCSPVVPGILFPHFAHRVSSRAKIIVILRDPAERVFSHWRWDQLALKRVKNDPLWQNAPGFPEIIRLEIELLKQGAGAGTSLSGTPVGGYIQGSMYLPFLRHLYKYYPRENIKVVNANAFFKDTLSVVRDIYQFLGLPEYEPVMTPVKNSGPKMDLDQETREILVDFFKSHNEQLYTFLGQDFGWSR
ncbi:MAG: hypothetical protein D6677_10590 [Calditrichaeota bacterium]|nr:MAG: hypothetical protein D6677_10590 [Calditrichota bacterium]